MASNIFAAVIFNNIGGSVNPGIKYLRPNRQCYGIETGGTVAHRPPETIRFLTKIISLPYLPILKCQL
jgi:hypothetical protein